jgi:AcrR family transcriptional regulator
LRERILEAARRLCFGGGVEALTARKIAAEVGCSATAIYLHFDSIEHLLHELRMEGHALLADYLRRPSAALDAVERLCAMQREYHRFGVDNPNYFRLMFLGRVDGAELGRLVASEGATLEIVRDAASVGLERGQIRAGLDALVIANTAWMAVHGITSMIVSGHAAVTAPGLEAELIASANAALGAWLAPAAGSARLAPAAESSRLAPGGQGARTRGRASGETS